MTATQTQNLSADEIARRLEEIGGRRWTKAGRDRVYFNETGCYIGLEIETYNTGNIAAAKLGGEAISNSRAKKILAALSGMSLYYDLGAGGLYYRGKLDSAGYCQDAINAVQAAIDEALS